MTAFQSCGPSKRKGLTLWVGGTSSLARTYVNQFGTNNLVFTGVESTPPLWATEHGIPYYSLDLTVLPKQAKVAEFLFERYPNIETIVVGVRPLLFAAHIHTRYHEFMVTGLQTLLGMACRSLKTLKFVLHASSVAAVDHLQAQVLWNESSSHPLPDLSSYKAPYDLFKRRCEEEITEVCQHQYNIPCCHLRLSAIFSDEYGCIQCSALELQCRVGCYLPLRIDCNSSANVSRAMDAILSRAEQRQAQSSHGTEGNVNNIKTVYYYTRPFLLNQPVAYGYYLQEFRKAYSMYFVSVPVWLVTYFVALFHWLASWNIYVGLPYVDATDYLLQVSARDHCFDCSRFAQDFPSLEEESILECFVRRKAVLESYRTKTRGKRV